MYVCPPGAQARCDASHAALASAIGFARLGRRGPVTPCKGKAPACASTLVQDFSQGVAGDATIVHGLRRPPHAQALGGSGINHSPQRAQSAHIGLQLPGPISRHSAAAKAAIASTATTPRIVTVALYRGTSGNGSEALVPTLDRAVAANARSLAVQAIATRAPQPATRRRLHEDEHVTCATVTRVRSARHGELWRLLNSRSELEFHLKAASAWDFCTAAASRRTEAPFSALASGSRPACSHYPWAHGGRQNRRHGAAAPPVFSSSGEIKTAPQVD